MHRVTENLFRGPRPTDIRIVLERGFQQIITTQSGDEDKLTDSLYEAQIRAKRADPEVVYPQLRLVQIKCSNIWPPTFFQVSEFLTALGTGMKTYVHCHSGVDRTGFLVACYQMQKLGMSFDDAYKEWVERGRHWWFDWWKFELERYRFPK